VTVGELSPARLGLGPRDRNTSEAISPWSILTPNHSNTSDSIVPLIFVFAFQIFRCPNLQHFSEPTPFYPPFLLICVKNKVISINKDYLLNISLQTYYRILGPKPNGIKDMALAIRPHSTVTIPVLEFSFSSSTQF
jgi:hypothetical protein